MLFMFVSAFWKAKDFNGFCLQEKNPKLMPTPQNKNPPQAEKPKEKNNKSDIVNISLKFASLLFTEH